MADDIIVNIKEQFEQFLSTVGNVLSNDKQIHLVQKNLRRHFKNAKPSYLSSTDFQSLLTEIHRTFNEHKESTRFFRLLNLLNEKLKKNNDKSIGSKKSSNESVHSIVISLRESPLSFSADDRVTSGPMLHETSDVCEQVPSNSSESSTSKTAEESRMATSSIPLEDGDTKRREKITRLERRLSRLANLIERLEQKELSLDEMIYSDLYNVEAKLKKRAYEVHLKLADLKRQSSSVNRILDQLVRLTDEEIDHPLINKALEDMVNQSRFLPSFHDVLVIVEQTNEKYELALSVEAQKKVAEKALKIIGTKVKDRRMADFLDIMKSRLPEGFDIEQNDPALNSVEIEQKLLKNEREAEQKTQEVFEEYSQIDPNVEPEIDIESSDELTTESGDEEDREKEENDEASSSESEPIQHDVEDIIILPSPVSPTLPRSNPSKTTHDDSPVEVPSEISFNHRTTTVLSTASIPLKRTACISYLPSTSRASPKVARIPDDDDDAEEFRSTFARQQSTVQTVIPRRRQEQQHEHRSTKNASRPILRSSDREKRTTNELSIVSKRPSHGLDSSRSKKRSQITEVTISD